MVTTSQEWQSIMEILKFTRKPFFVDVVLVTAENMREVADWCGGKVLDKPNPRNKSQMIEYIKVDVERPLTEKQTMAYVGNYVLRAGRGFKVYTKSGLDKTFDAVDQSVIEKNTPINMPKNFAKYLGTGNGVKTVITTTPMDQASDAKEVWIESNN